MVAVLPKLRGMAFGLVRNGCDPDDLVQCACERLLDPKYGVRRWSVGARSAMIDHVRRHGRVRLLHKRRDLKYRPVGERRALREVAAEETPPHGVFWDHFAFLPAEQLRAVRLHVEGGVRKRDVGRQLGLTEMQAHRLIGGGLALIRERWAKQGHAQKECA